MSVVAVAVVIAAVLVALATAVLLLPARRGLPRGWVTDASPVSAREAVAAGVLATRSLRSGSVPYDVPELDADLAAYFHRGQRGPDSSTFSS